MSTFTFIKSKISILDVVSQYATLKKAGFYWKGRCPFHQEKTASFTISPHKEIFYCFGCHAGGDVITFVAKIENCSPLDAAKILIERHGITVPAGLGTLPATPDNHEQERHQRYYQICALFAYWSHDNLLKNQSVINYLHSRGFETTHINAFELGHVPGGLTSIRHCVEYFRQHHFLLQDLIDAHIIARGKTMLYSPFEDRILFPIKDHLGRSCGFGGRIFKENDTRPKYYNSRENEFFVKGSLLFGLDRAKKAIQERSSAILVEGYTDCIAMVQHGFAHTIATLGTACTAAHLKLLARYANTLFVLYDGDQAGRAAIIRLAQLCWQANMDLKVVLLPNGHDPASYLAAGQKLEPLLEQAQDIFIFFVNSLGSNFNTKPLTEKMQTIKSLLQTISLIDEPLKRDVLLQEASSVLNMPFEALNQELGRLAHKNSLRLPASDQENQQNAPATPKPANTLALTELEERLFCSIVNNPDLVTPKNEGYVIDYMNEPLRGILKKTLENHTNRGTFDNFFDMLDEEQKLLVSRLLAQHDVQMTPEVFGNVLLQLQRHRWRQMVQIIKKQLAQAKNRADTQETNRLLNAFIELKKKLLTTADASSQEQAT